MKANTTHNTDQLLQEAECNALNNRFHEAVSLYETVLAHNSTTFSAYYSLGAIYERLQEINKAKDVYKKGIVTAKLFQNKTIETELSFTLLGLMD